MKSYDSENRVDDIIIHHASNLLEGYQRVSIIVSPFLVFSTPGGHNNFFLHHFYLLAPRRLHWLVLTRKTLVRGDPSSFGLCVQVTWGLPRRKSIQQQQQ